MYGSGDGVIGCHGDRARVWQRRYDTKTDGKRQHGVKTEGTTMKEQKRRKQTRLKKIGIGRSSDPRSSRNPKRAAHQNLNVAVENFQQGERARSLQEREGELQQRPSAHSWRFQRLKCPQARTHLLPQVIFAGGVQKAANAMKRKASNDSERSWDYLEKALREDPASVGDAAARHQTWTSNAGHTGGYCA